MTDTCEAIETPEEISRLAAEPASSATTLFPQRVWPD